MSPRVSDPTVIDAVDKQPDPDGMGWTVTVTWSGGAAPYTAVGSTSPGFEWGVRTVGKELSGLSFEVEVEKGSMAGGYFFEVVSGAVVSPAVEGMGYDPEPAPRIQSVSPFVTWWGQPVEITATYLDPIAPANLTFVHRAAVRAASVTVPAGSVYAGSAVFTVPADARSAQPAVVGAHGRISPGGGVIGLIPPQPAEDPTVGVPQYSNIRGVVWGKEAGNGHLFVAADGVVSEVDLFTTTPGATVRESGLSGPLISQVSDGGTLVMVDGVAGAAEIWVMDVGGGPASVFAHTSDAGFSRPITPVGIALSADGQVAYVADSQGGTVVRIPIHAGMGGDAIEDHWGGKSDLVFPVPAGMDVNVNGSVLVMDNSGGGRLWELVDATTANFKGTLGSDIHVLAIDREISTGSTARFLYSTAPGAAEAFNLEEIELLPGPGGTGPPAYHGSIVYGTPQGFLQLTAEDDRYGPYPVTPGTPQRVVISSGGKLLPYTSEYQEEDRTVRMTFKAWPGLEFRVRLIDPPDTAPYAPDGGWDMGRAKRLPYEGNDNAEDLATADVGLSPSPGGPWSRELDVTPGADGLVTVYLQVTGRYAGDNYQVEMTKCGPVGCAAGHLPHRVVALSPIFTAWKRIHIERDRMFRRGGVLAEDYVPWPDCGGADPLCLCTGGAGDPECCDGIGPIFCNQVVAYEWQNAAAGDLVAVFDEVFTFETAPEIRSVTAVGSADAHGLVRVTLDEGLRLPHLRAARVEPDPPEKYQPTFSNHKSAGFGVISGCDLSSNQLNAQGSCFYQADLRGVENVFNDGFVEVFAPRAGRNVLPFVGPPFFDGFELAQGSSCSNPVVQRRAGYSFTPWFDFGWTWFGGRGDPNAFWLGGVGNTAQLDGCTACGGANHLPQVWGMTRLHANESLVFQGGIEAYCPSPAQLANAAQMTTGHEIGHQFYVNIGTSQSGHDERCDWLAGAGVTCATPAVTCTDPAAACLMNPGSDRWSSRHRLDRFDLFCGDPGCPDGSDGCCTSCALEGNGSVRRLQDPVIGGQP